MEQSRYIQERINQRKGSSAVFDPFLVKPGWFQVELPSLQLLMTNDIPGENRSLVEFTLERLGLVDGESILRQRRAWFEPYQTGEISIDFLHKRAPMIAEAVERDLNAGIDWRIVKDQAGR